MVSGSSVIRMYMPVYSPPFRVGLLEFKWHPLPPSPSPPQSPICPTDSAPESRVSLQSSSRKKQTNEKQIRSSHESISYETIQLQGNLKKWNNHLWDVVAAKDQRGESCFMPQTNSDCCSNKRVLGHGVGETLPTNSQMWTSHFSSYIVIELFLRRCLNDYILLVFVLLHFFVSFCLTTGGTLGTLGLNLSGI